VYPLQPPLYGYRFRICRSFDPATFSRFSRFIPCAHSSIARTPFLSWAKGPVVSTKDGQSGATAPLHLTWWDLSIQVNQSPARLVDVITQIFQGFDDSQELLRRDFPRDFMPIDILTNGDGYPTGTIVNPEFN